MNDFCLKTNVFYFKRNWEALCSQNQNHYVTMQIVNLTSFDWNIHVDRWNPWNRWNLYYADSFLGFYGLEVLLRTYSSTAHFISCSVLIASCGCGYTGNVPGPWSSRDPRVLTYRRRARSLAHVQTGPPIVWPMPAPALIVSNLLCAGTK